MTTRIDVGGDGGAADPAKYPVVIGTGVLSELPGLVGADVRSVALIHAAGLGEIARPVHAALEAAGFLVHPQPVPDGEAAKEHQVSRPSCGRASRPHASRAATRSSRWAGER